MIRPNSFNSLLIEQKLRKKIHVDVINDKSYNQFEGNSNLDVDEWKNQSNTRNQQFYDFETKHNQKNKDQVNIEQQISQYSKIFSLVSKQGQKFKKVDQKANTSKVHQNKNQKSSKIKVEENQLKKQQQPSIPQVKFEQGQEEVEELKKQKIQNKKVQKTPKAKVTQQPSSNWKKFMQQSTTKNKNPQQQVSPPSKFIAIDCEFVKCGQSDQLARISLISEHGQVLFDSYIKPAKKVTDYLTAITGITFSHLKNAPTWEQEVGKVKKILMNKILVGHTLHKDLQVCKLTDWKGISQKIDISQFSLYRQKNGSKVVSLKRMALSFLNKNIQSGWHSSVQDATVTMDLFKLNRKKMLKQFKII